MVIRSMIGAADIAWEGERRTNFRVSFLFARKFEHHHNCAEVRVGRTIVDHSLNLILAAMTIEFDSIKRDGSSKHPPDDQEPAHGITE